MGPKPITVGVYADDPGGRGLRYAICTLRATDEAQRMRLHGVYHHVTWAYHIPCAHAGAGSGGDALRNGNISYECEECGKMPHRCR